LICGGRLEAAAAAEYQSRTQFQFRDREGGIASSPQVAAATDWRTREAPAHSGQAVRSPNKNAQPDTSGWAF